MSRVELLSPAGDYECFIAAINAGADAVYLGGSKFGARAYADNFSEDEIIRALNYAHMYGRKVYLTVNTVIKNREFDELWNFLTPLYRNGLDGVIVQDIGAVKFIHDNFPDMEIHSSTQMAITSFEGVKLMQELGICRVVPARELSLDELKQIKKETGIELETFIHGAMCYSYSGKCLFSSFLGERSGNRGRCAGTCRLPFDNRYPLSMKDMCTLRILNELIDSGIYSFKIEGRMKSKEYVAGVTGIYRKYIDLYLSGKPYVIDKKDEEELLRLYTRSGNCSGYYKEYNGKDMITIQKPGYHMADAKMQREVFNKYFKSPKKRSVSATAVFTEEMSCLTIYDNDISVTVYGMVPDRSDKRPLEDNTVRKQLMKLGDTFIDFSSLEIFVNDNLFMPIAALNDLRRNAVLEYEKEFNKQFIREYSADRPINSPESFIEDKMNCREVFEQNGSVNCTIFDIGQLEAVIKYSEVDEVSISFEAFLSYTFDRAKRHAWYSEAEGHDIEQSMKTIAALIRQKNKRVYLCFPYVIRSSFFRRHSYLDRILSQEIFDGVYADNYDVLEYLRLICYNGEIRGDIHLYSLNDICSRMYEKLGIGRITFPVELNSKELMHLRKYRYEQIVYGRIPLMVSAQCINRTLGSCRLVSGQGVIKDRKACEFVYINNCFECSNIIFNSMPIYISNRDLEKMSRTDLNRRYLFTVEDKAAVDLILSDLINGKEPEKYTKGHYGRGVE